MIKTVLENLALQMKSESKISPKLYNDNGNKTSILATSSAAAVTPTAQIKSNNTGNNSNNSSQNNSLWKWEGP